MTAATLLIRTDASVTIGTGHAMRCLALAQAWSHVGGRAVVAMAESTASVRARLTSESCEVVSISALPGELEDARQTVILGGEIGANWIVVDGYQFTSEYQLALKTSEAKVLFLDDYGHARHYSADIVLNQNVCAKEQLYASRDLGTRLLLGPRYCLLRHEFSAWRDWKRQVLPVARRVLVTMGGSDAGNLTARVIEGLSWAGLGDLRVTVVVGGSSLHFGSIQRSANQSGLNIEILKDVTNMGELMAAADVIVSAAGSICGEICLMGLPAVLIDAAENQTELAKELDRRGCALHAGNSAVLKERIAEEVRGLVLNHELRRSLSQCCRGLVDGYGAPRVVGALRGTEGLRLRNAKAEDMRLLWEWANDSEVRAASFSAAPIPWEAHVSWFAEKFGKGRSLILIAENDDGVPLGQVRFDLRDKEADLNISLARERRGYGFGAPLIRTAVRELFARTGCRRVHAFVKVENAASARAFENANFARVGVEQVGECSAIHFACERN